MPSDVRPIAPRRTFQKEYRSPAAKTAPRALSIAPRARPQLAVLYRSLWALAEAGLIRSAEPGEC